MNNCQTVWYYVKPIRFNDFSNITLVTFSGQNISWMAEWEYLICKAKCRLTCLLCMPTTKYETIKTQTNLKQIIAWSSLNVLMNDNIQNIKTHKMDYMKYLLIKALVKEFNTGFIHQHMLPIKFDSRGSHNGQVFLGVHKWQWGVHMLWKVHRNTNLWEFSRQFSRNNSCNRFLPPG